MASSQFVMSSSQSVQFSQLTRVPNSQLGQGAFGEVHKYQLTQPPHGYYAVKIINLGDKEALKRMAIQEGELLRRLGNHPSIVQFYDFQIIGNVAHIVMELCSEALTGYLMRTSTVPPDLAMCNTFCKQLASGLAFLHGKGIAHRDLKPDNILLQNLPYATMPTAKIADLGMATMFDNGLGPENYDRMLLQASQVNNLSAAGTIGFRAPEAFGRLLGQSHVCITENCDIFSLGLVFLLIFNRNGLPIPSINGLLFAQCSQDMINAYVKSIGPLGTPFVPPENQQGIIGMLQVNHKNRALICC